MVKAVLAALGVTLGLLAIPLVHFVTGPVGPFVGGFIGGGMLKAHPARALGLGLLMGLVVAGVAGIVIFVIGFLLQVVTGDIRTLVIVAGAGASLYISLLGTAGAVVGGHMARRSRKEEQGVSASPSGPG